MIQKDVHPTAEHQRALMQKYDATLQAEEQEAQVNDGMTVN
jgi:hypothetical protein